MDKKEKKRIKDILIFIGAVVVLIFTALPAALASNITIHNGGTEFLALISAIAVGCIYMLITAYLYGRFVIYPNEEIV